MAMDDTQPKQAQPVCPSSYLTLGLFCTRTFTDTLPTTLILNTGKSFLLHSFSHLAGIEPEHFQLWYTHTLSKAYQISSWTESRLVVDWTVFIMNSILMMTLIKSDTNPKKNYAIILNVITSELLEDINKINTWSWNSEKINQPTYQCQMNPIWIIYRNINLLELFKPNDLSPHLIQKNIYYELYRDGLRLTFKWLWINKAKHTNM